MTSYHFGTKRTALEKHVKTTVLSIWMWTTTQVKTSYSLDCCYKVYCFQTITVVKLPHIFNFQQNITKIWL